MEETLVAKLRNKLSPSYILAEMLLLAEGNPELLELCFQQARVAVKCTDPIDSLLKQIEIQISADSASG